MTVLDTPAVFSLLLNETDADLVAEILPSRIGFIRKPGACRSNPTLGKCARIHDKALGT